jgi:hypothetical protein
MAFGSCTSLQDVARRFQLSVAVDAFIKPAPYPVDERFEKDLTFALQNVAVRMSEASICEFLIAPVLKEVLKAYNDALLIWSHIPLGVQEPLLGTPDYFSRGARRWGWCRTNHTCWSSRLRRTISTPGGASASLQWSPRSK